MDRKNKKETSGTKKGAGSPNQLWNNFADEFLPPILRRFFPFVADTAIDEDDRRVSFACEVVGIPKKDIQVEVVRNRLIIKGRCADERCAGTEDRFVRSRYRHAFRRSFALPDGVEVERGEAKFRNGLLTVTFPKREQKLTRHIPVEGQAATRGEPHEIQRTEAA